MRAIWKGSISFNLVNIPIALYPATRHQNIQFHLLRASDLSPIRYKRIAETDGEEVPWEQIVKGCEYQKDQYVVLTDDDLERVDIPATQSVDIIDFVDLTEINPVFFDKPYYLEPQKGGAKAYALLRQALQQTGKVGIAKVVIKTRQHLAALKPQAKALILELMQPLPSENSTNYFRNLSNLTPPSLTSHPPALDLSPDSPPPTSASPLGSNPNSSAKSASPNGPATDASVSPSSSAGATIKTPKKSFANPPPPAPTDFPFASARAAL